MAAALGPILFVVVVVGGLGSLPGALIASLLIGLIQTFAVAVNVSLADMLGHFGFTLTRDSIGGDLWMATVAQVAPIIPYMLLVLVLIFRPKGLMGDRDT
jgi:branched-chain amino acid transport system permease protein